MSKVVIAYKANEIGQFVQVDEPEQWNDRDVWTLEIEQIGSERFIRQNVGGLFMSRERLVGNYIDNPLVQRAISLVFKGA